MHRSGASLDPSCPPCRHAHTAPRDLPVHDARLTAARNIIAVAFDIQCVYRPYQKQATVVVTITDATPGSITALIADPRTDVATGTGTFGDTPSER